MPAMRVVGTGHELSERARLRREPDEYVIELDVAGFSGDELSIEALGPTIILRGDQRELPSRIVPIAREHNHILNPDAEPC